MKRLNKKGFTLVELLAVIVILALLMVVAARLIGGSMDNSKKEAMRSEAAKVVAKTYEDLQIAKVQNKTVSASDLTYKDATDTSKGFAEGEYNVKITLDSTDQYKMATVCISYGTSTKKYGSATVSSDGTLNWGTDDANLYTDTAC